MRLKKFLIASTVVFFAIGFASCKKDNNSNTSADTTTETKMQADDQAFFSNETDIATNDVNASIDINGGSYNQTPAGINSPILSLPCDATITVDTTSNPRTITINYNGNNCNLTRKRTGSVVVSFAPAFKWGTAQAQLTVKFVNFKVIRNVDGKSIVINGTRTITNVSGGLLKNLATLDSIEHKIDDTNMSITFDNGAQRTWETHFTRVFTYNNGIVISTTGNISGKNRFNDDFSCTILHPLVIEQGCDFRLVSGQAEHTGPKVNATITFGLDTNGNPVNSCPLLFYLKVAFTGSNGNTLSYLLPY
ncbi:hypothetical protein FW778_06975 [Ginsengibacter hankyongi]|uniref:Lipoprotein n=1 Tax=Ginsengibacter hankyongi TaxID=2607284 RepID=A0A5J5IN42_9BACT|nr:hypothetical protein [Ginsengibacter hankyongi]KAA9041753.1 hypothetical protein FW778_06975 [Ginsengibacter hankyongi]